MAHCDSLGSACVRFLRARLRLRKGTCRAFASAVAIAAVALACGPSTAQNRTAAQNLRQYKWLRRVNAEIERLGADDGAGEEERLVRILDEVEPLVDAGEVEGGDPAWALYKGARALADRRQGNPEFVDEEIHYLEMARKASFALKSVSAHANVSMRLGRLLTRLGRIADAEEVLCRAYESLPADDERRSYIGLSLGILAPFRGAWDEGLDRLASVESSLIEGTSGIEMRRAMLYGRRGQIYLGMGVLDRASRWIEEARRLRDIHRDDPDWLEIRAELDIYRANLRLAAERHATLEREVLEVLEENDDYRGLPSVRSSLRLRLAMALIPQERGNPEREKRAESIVRQIEADPVALATDRRSARTWLAYLSLLDGRIDEADRLVSDLVSSEASASEMGITDDQLGMAFHRALRVRIELARGADRPLVEEADRELASAFKELRKEWEKTRLRKGGLGLLQYSRARSILSELMRVTMHLSPGDAGVERALTYLFEAQALGTMSRGFQSPTATVQEIRRTFLASGEGLLIYLPGGDQSHLFVLDSSGLDHVLLASGDLLKNRQQELLRIVLRPPDRETSGERVDDLRRVCRSMSQVLIPQAAEEALRRWRRVTIVGLDLLGYLPFECLVLSDGSVLGLEMPVAYMPSASVGLALVTRREAREVSIGSKRERFDATFIHSPIHAEDAKSRFSRLLPLDLDDRELGSMLDVYRDSRVRVVRREMATFSAVTEAAKESRVLSLLTHGVHHPTAERSAGLILSPAHKDDDGLIWADQMEGLDAPPLVVLLACATGRGPVRSGDAGASDLGGILLARGADAVVLPVSDLLLLPTLHLSSVFHRGLAGGLSPAEALLDARRALVSREGGRFDDPFYYALLHVHGLGHRPIFSEAVGGRRPSFALLLGALAVIGVAVGLLAWRRFDRVHE